MTSSLSTQIPRLRYSPFAQPTDRIRVLETLSKDDTGQLHCTLQETHLKSSYRCLSYMWGTDEPTNRLLVNGQLLLIRNNLHAFLCQAEKHQVDGDAPLWIDAVCINQDDLHERSSQVSIMGDIYTAAECTIIWLGLSNKSVDRAFDLAADCARDYIAIVATNRRNKAPDPRLDHEDIFNRDDFTFPDEYHQAVKEQLNEPERIPNDRAQFLDDYESILETIEAFSSIPYWGRLWTVQEIMLSKSLIVWCGTRQIPSPWLGSIRAIFNGADIRPGHRLHSRFDPIKGAPFMRTWRQHSIYRLEHKIAVSHFFRLLDEFQSYGCADPKDKIYALRALANSQILPVSYDIENKRLLEQVFDSFPSDEPILQGFRLAKALKLSDQDLLMSDSDSFAGRRWRDRTTRVYMLGQEKLSTWTLFALGDSRSLTNSCDYLSIEINDSGTLRCGDLLFWHDSLALVFALRGTNSEQSLQKAISVGDYSEYHCVTILVGPISGRQLHFLEGQFTGAEIKHGLVIRSPLSLLDTNLIPVIRENVGVQSKKYIFLKWKALVGFWTFLLERPELIGTSVLEIEEGILYQWIDVAESDDKNNSKESSNSFVESYKSFVRAAGEQDQQVGKISTHQSRSTGSWAAMAEKANPSKALIDMLK